MSHFVQDVLIWVRHKHKDVSAVRLTIKQLSLIGSYFRGGIRMLG